VWNSQRIEYAALPLYLGEETLDEPASHIATQPSSILRRRLDAIGAVWRDHLDTISSQFLVERIAVMGVGLQLPGDCPKNDTRRWPLDPTESSTRSAVPVEHWRKNTHFRTVCG
jgi:hypothetical protein